MRTERLSLRLTEDEAQMLELRASRAGQSMAEYVRSRALREEDQEWQRVLSELVIVNAIVQGLQGQPVRLDELERNCAAKVDSVIARRRTALTEGM
jgi:uncharacterized protein (DUF1778 family)